MRVLQSSETMRASRQESRGRTKLLTLRYKGDTIKDNQGTKYTQDIMSHAVSAISRKGNLVQDLLPVLGLGMPVVTSSSWPPRVLSWLTDAAAPSSSMSSSWSRRLSRRHVVNGIIAIKGCLFFFFTFQGWWWLKLYVRKNSPRHSDLTAIMVLSVNSSIIFFFFSDSSSKRVMITMMMMQGCKGMRFVSHPIFVGVLQSLLQTLLQTPVTVMILLLFLSLRGWKKCVNH